MRNGTLRVGAIAVAAVALFTWVNKKTLKAKIAPYN